MNKQEHLLTLMIEECAEVAQRCTKILRFGIDEIQEGHELSNRERLKYEFNDLITVSALLNESGINLEVEPKDLEKKMQKISKYMNYSKELGLLKE